MSSDKEKEKDKNSPGGKQKSSSNKDSTAKTEISKPRRSKSRGAKSSARSRSRSPISKSKGNRPSICKQFMNNACNRGINCPFYHPPQKAEDKKPWFVVCLDFRNGRCPRNDCRYFHITQEDEQKFVRTGEISPKVIDQAMQKVVPVGRDGFNKAPICKDFIKYSCKTKCRYRHVNRQEYEEDVLKALRIELALHVGVDRPKSRGRDGPLPFEPSPMIMPGNYEMAPVGNMGFDGDMRMPDHLQFNNNFQREQQLILPSHFQGPNAMQMGNMSPAPFPRDFHPSEVEGIRREYEQLREDFLLMKREKEEEILDLHRKFGARELNSGGFDQFGSSNDGLLYRQLQADLQKIYNQNELLMKEFRDNISREKSKEEAKMKSLLKENLESHQRLKDKEAEILSLKSEVKVLEKFKSFVIDQTNKIQKQLVSTEYDMSQSWGGGAPPLNYMRQSWPLLKSLIMKLNPSSAAAVPTPAVAAALSTAYPGVSATTSYGTQNTGYQIETLKSGGTNSAYSSVNNAYSGGNNSYSGGAGNNSYSTGSAGNNSYSGAGNNSYSGGGNNSYSGGNNSYSGGNSSYSGDWASSQTNKPPSSTNYNQNNQNVKGRMESW